ncbi:MAG: hypothetical protein WDN31_00575 [Hyphomicrobium sp.]
MPPCSISPSPALTTQPLFWSLSAYLIVHILIIASSLRIMYEEKRVMEGSLSADKMTFSALDAVNNVPILASSTAFYILGLAALIQTVEHTGLAQILRHRPTLGNEYGEYLACVLNEIPIVNSVISAWANLVDLSDNLNAQIVYNGLTGNSVRLVIVVTLSIIVVRALLLRLQQWSHQVSMAHALENGTVSPDAVKKRLVRVPTTLNSRLMRSALTHPPIPPFAAARLPPWRASRCRTSRASSWKASASTSSATLAWRISARRWPP